MEPTLDIKQRILVNRFIYHFTTPEPGDVVVFHPPVGSEYDPSNSCAEEGWREDGPQACPASLPEKSDDTFVKRIVAGPGDTLSIEKGIPIVNGEPSLPDGYEITPCGIGGSGCNYPEEITIPEGHYYMMGDNRGQSFDSRFWGPLPEEWLIGKAFGTYWPPNRIGGL